MADDRNMPPWDTIQYFKAPTVKTTIPPVTATQVADADPNRVVLIFSCPRTGGNILVGINPSMAAQSDGMIVSTNTLPVIITQRDYGPLCQVAWYAIGDGIAPVTVWTVSLTKWPGDKSSVRTPTRRDDEKPIDGGSGY